MFNNLMALLYTNIIANYSYTEIVLSVNVIGYTYNYSKLEKANLEIIFSNRWIELIVV